MRFWSTSDGPAASNKQNLISQSDAVLEDRFKFYGYEIKKKNCFAVEVHQQSSPSNTPASYFYKTKHTIQKLY